MNTKELGNLGEKLACEYLVDKGFKILGKNYSITSGRNKIFGEIDIISTKDKVIHFVEVKALKSKANLHPELVQGWFPEQHADYRKQQKLRRLAEIWLDKNRYSIEQAFQIDLIVVLINEETKYSDIEYFPNAVEG